MSRLWYHPYSTYAKYPKKLIYLTLCGRNVSFSENFANVLNGWSLCSNWVETYRHWLELFPLDLFIKLFQVNVPFPHRLITSGKSDVFLMFSRDVEMEHSAIRLQCTLFLCTLTVSWCFQGVEKRFIGSEWINLKWVKSEHIQCAKLLLLLSTLNMYLFAAIAHKIIASSLIGLRETSQTS